MKPATAPTIVTTNEERSIATLSADPKNARQHSESQISEIVRSIQTFGYVAPVIVQPSGQIIGGHATVEALKRLDRTDVDVRVVHGLTASAYKKLGLALNKLPENSRWNDDVLREVMGEIDADGGDLNIPGFSSKEIEKLLAEPDDLEVAEIETGPVEDEAWISVRAPLAQQANVLKALQTVMKEFPDVTVEQGVISLG